MTQQQGVSAPRLVIECDTLEQYEASVRDFLAAIFGMDADNCLMTDISQLKDFSFSGDWPAPDLNSHSLGELYRDWDKWVLARICEQYDLEPGSFDTQVTMIALMELIAQRARRPLH